MSRAIRGRGGGVALGVVVVIIVVDLLLRTIVAVAIAGAAELARGREFVILVVVVLVRRVVVVVRLDHGLVIDGEGVLQGMDVVLLVDSDLAQVDVEEAGVEAPVSTADKLKIGAVQIVDVDLGIVRFDVGHIEDVILGHVNDRRRVQIVEIGGPVDDV